MSEKVKSAQCYDTKAWQAYQAGTLGESEMRALEEHLSFCESCLERYLELIENGLSSGDIQGLGEDFTDQVMALIEQEQRWQKASVPVVNLRSQKKSKETVHIKAALLISYCAAASIAMFFWIGGYFDGLAGSLSKGVDYIRSSEVVETKVQPQKGFIQTGWTQKVIEEERPSFIENLIPKKE